MSGCDNLGGHITRSVIYLLFMLLYIPALALANANGYTSVEENTQDEVALIWDAYGFSQIPIDAQTGKMKVITTGDEEAFSVPKVITWEDVQ